MTRRWGLIGTGDIARKRVAPALRDSPLCDLVAASRGRPHPDEAFAASFGIGRWHPRWQDLIADRDIDCVYIATPVHLHAAQTIAAAQAGKHVLCEKPMAMSVAECDEMIAACAANGVTLGIAYYRRFYPAIERARQLVASGAIGQPVIAQINAFEWCDVRSEDDRGWFMRKAESGGGPMFDFGCHRIEVLMNVLGPVRDVTSLMGNVVFTREVEDTAMALLRFESGACATLSVTHAAVESKDTFDVFGTRGSIHIENLNRGDLRLHTPSGDSPESHPPDPNLHRPLIDDFAEAVLTGRPPAVTGETGRAVARIEEEVYSRARLPLIT